MLKKILSSQIIIYLMFLSTNSVFYFICYDANGYVHLGNRLKTSSSLKETTSINNINTFLPQPIQMTSCQSAEDCSNCFDEPLFNILPSEKLNNSILLKLLCSYCLNSNTFSLVHHKYNSFKYFSYQTGTNSFVFLSSVVLRL